MTALGPDPADGAAADSRSAIDPLAATGTRDNEASDRTKPIRQGKLPQHRRLIYRNLEEGIRQLPPYAKSLLRVQVPVTVTLATAKTSVSKILDMGPGTILQFKKACDSNLTMEVGQQTVAEGEAVKVGDKFGLWITSMTMPGERFWSVKPTSPPQRVK